MTSTFTRNPRTLVPQRRNRVENPRSFNDIVGYTDVSSPGVAAVVSRGTGVGSPVGSQCCRVTLSAVASGWWGAQYGNVGMSPGLTGFFSAYVRVNAAHTATVTIEYRDASNALLSTTSATTVALAANTWTRLSVSATAPANTAYANVRARVMDGGAIGNNIEVTGLLFELGDVLGAYFDGATPDADPFYYRWTGTAHASASTENILDPNDVTTPVQVNGYQSTSSARTTAHQVANTSQVVVAVRPAGPRQGSFELLYDDVADAMTAEALFREGGLYDFADDDVPDVGMTFAPAEGQIEVAQDDTRQAWLVTVPYVEVI